MEDNQVSTGQSLRQLIASVFLLVAMVIVAWIGFNTLINTSLNDIADGLAEMAENRYAEPDVYIFPDGMTPIALISGNKHTYPMIFLCQTTEGIYTECSPTIRE